MASAQSIAGDARQNNNRIARIKNYILNNIDCELTLKSIADEVFITEAYLSRYFRKSTGICITSWIVSKRIELSKILLLESDMTIEQISCKTGFGSKCTFGRHFKNSEGLSPRQYRKLRREYPI